MTAYKRLTLYERQKIEEGLDQSLSFRSIAGLIGRTASTISREVKANRVRKDKGKRSRHASCREKSACRVTNICKTCSYPGTLCKTCPDFHCRGRCSIYRKQVSCMRLDKAPWVCNGCSKRSFGCNRPVRMFYTAKVADTHADETKRHSRSGFDMGEREAQRIGEYIHEGLLKGLSPYEISVAYKDKVPVSPSTIYRMVNAGVADCKNIYLERKVGFKPRRHSSAKSSTSHDKARRYAAFLTLGEDRQNSATEMDCICGRKIDGKCALTIYMRPSHLQIALLLDGQTSEHVVKALTYIKSICPKDLFETLFFTALTDNGPEFSDEEALDKLFGGSKDEPRLYYCDPRRSDQKASCEKNHSEIRQILPKGKTPFDELDAWDLAVVSSHVNSSPRLSLGGLSPIGLFKLQYGEQAEALLDDLGIAELAYEELCLKPKILDIERAKRGLNPINRR